MENLFIDETHSSPSVKLDAEKHVILFEGDSRPEDVQEFYIPILHWFEAYSKYLANCSADITLKCEFKLGYFNSSSSKYVLDVMRCIKSISAENSNVQASIFWYYEEMDEDMFDSGKEYEKIVGGDFNFIKL